MAGSTEVLDRLIGTFIVHVNQAQRKTSSPDPKDAFRGGESGGGFDHEGVHERLGRLPRIWCWVTSYSSRSRRDWFEEPVSIDDTAGLAHLRDQLHCDIAAGEYVADNYEVRSLLPVRRLPTTRRHPLRRLHRLARQRRISPHSKSASLRALRAALHAPVAAATSNLRHIEWFADHARLEPILIEGCPTTTEGALNIDYAGPGHGMSISPAASAYRTA
jgi:hypothetical protein